MEEGAFRLLGDCLGSTVEVDQNTISKKNLSYGRVKVLMGNACSLPVKIPLWVDDLKFFTLL